MENGKLSLTCDHVSDPRSSNPAVPKAGSVRIRFRRANDAELLEGGWTSVARNEVTLETQAEQSLVFRNGKYVGIYWNRASRTNPNRATESPPAPFRLTETGRGKTIAFEGAAGFVAARFALGIRSVDSASPQSQNAPISASYRIEGNELTLALFTDPKRFGSEAPLPMPKNEEEATKQGALLLRFTRGYRKPQDGAAPAVEAEPPASSKAQPPSTAKPGDEARQPPTVQAITEKMRDAIKEALDGVERRFELGSSMPDCELFSSWSRLLCQAEVDLAENSAARLKAIEAHVGRVKAAEERNKLRYDSGVIPIQEYRILTYRRLEAERWLEEEKLKAKK